MIFDSGYRQRQRNQMWRFSRFSVGLMSPPKGRTLVLGEQGARAVSVARSSAQSHSTEVHWGTVTPNFQEEGQSGTKGLRRLFVGEKRWPGMANSNHF